MSSIRCWASGMPSGDHLSGDHEMQARAIFEAAVAVEKQGIKTHAEVMIPLIAT